MKFMLDLVEGVLHIWDSFIKMAIGVLTLSPESLDPSAWNVIHIVIDSLKGVGYALIPLFFFFSYFKAAGSLVETKRAEAVFKTFVRLVLTKVLIDNIFDLLVSILNISQGLIARIANATGIGIKETNMNDGLRQAIEDSPGIFSGGIGNLVFILIFCIVTLVIGVMIIAMVYMRVFRIFLYTAIAPLPIATFAGESTQQHGIQFFRAYVGVCLQGLVMMLCFVVWSAFASGNILSGLFPGTEIRSLIMYLVEMVIVEVMVVAIVKAADSVVKEIFGL